MTETGPEQKLFCYGSLMLPDLREHLIQKKSNQSAAIEKGFRRFKVRQRTYPGLIAEGKSEVRGVIIYPLDLDDFEKLDEYEGLEYYRSEIEVLNEDSGKLEMVQAYLYNKTYTQNITDQSWDLSQLNIEADCLI